MSVRNDVRCRIRVNSAWEDISTYVRHNLYEIFTGRQDESDEINPGTCSFTLKNEDGRFTPDNPMGPWYGSLDINTPVVILLDEMRDSFTRTAPDTWGDTTTGETYSTKSLNGVISATDFSTDGSMGVHSVPAVNAYRMSYFDTTSRAPLAYNSIQKIKYIPQFTDVTGAPIEPANLQCRLVTNSNYYMLRVEVQTDESITLKILHSNGTTLGGPVTVPGITHVVGQGIWFALGALNDELCATAWQGDSASDVPTNWLLTCTDPNSSWGYGRFGVRTGVANGNTNVKPVIAKYDNYTIYVAEFTGEIPDYPQTFDTSNTVHNVEIEAAGISRRLGEGNAPFKSSLRRYYEQFAVPAPDFYWPLEEGELATEARPSIGDVTKTAILDPGTSVSDTSGQKHFSQATLTPWLAPGLTLLNGDVYSAVLTPTNITAQRWVADWVRQGGIGSIDAMVITGVGPSGGDIYAIDYDETTNSITVRPGVAAAPTAITATTLANNPFDGGGHHYRFRANASGGGADTFWEFTMDGSVIASGTVFGQVIWSYFGQVASQCLASDAKPGYGHWALFITSDPFSDITNAYNHFRGYAGELADARVTRICTEENIQDFVSTSDGAAMGPQFRKTLLEQFNEIMNTDGGIIRELLSAPGYQYDTLESIRSRTVGLTLDVSAHEISNFLPVKDPKFLRNKITAKKESGGDVTWEQTTGRLGTADPKDGGSGIYDDEIDCNPESEQQLYGIAQREVSRGTVSKPRFPELTVNIHSSPVEADLTLRRQILDMYVTGRILLTNMTANHIYSNSDLLVIGMTRLLSSTEHMITWNTVPFDTYDIFIVEDTGSRIGTNSSQIVADVNSSTTALDVVTDGISLWTTTPASFPIEVVMGGEEMSLTAVTTTAPSFRSVGAASHADNANTTPGLPAGTVAGDLLLLVTAIRNTGAVANIPAGYTGILGSAHFNIAYKVSVGGGEVAPTCTYSGGALGDTTSSFIMALANCIFGFGNGNLQTNGSVQNIGYPSITIPRSNGIGIFVGWKQDDYTSVAPPGALIEIIEASTVTGNDQSLYAAYQVFPLWEDNIIADSFVVTGGAAAISKAFTLFFPNPQRLTVTRSINGVVKGHTAGARIDVANPKRIG